MKLSETLHGRINRLKARKGTGFAVFTIANATMLAANLLISGMDDQKTQIKQPIPAPPASSSPERTGNTTVFPGKCYFMPGDYLSPEENNNSMFIEFLDPNLQKPVYNPPPHDQADKKPISL